MTDPVGTLDQETTTIATESRALRATVRSLDQQLQRWTANVLLLRGSLAARLDSLDARLQALEERDR